MTAACLYLPLRQELQGMRSLAVQMLWHHFIVEICLIAAFLYV